MQKKLGLVLLGGVLGLGGCDDSPGSGPDLAGADLAVPQDLAMAVPDLAQPRDLAMMTGDLAPPKVTIPDGCQATASAEDVYAVVGSSCALNYCHGNNHSYFQAISAADMRTKWVNRASAQGASMPYVTPGNVDRSFVLFKLMGEQGRVSSAPGGPMPQGRAMLSNAQICVFVAWIKNGAN